MSEAGESRFRAIFDFVNDGILIVAVENFAFIDANPRMCQMFGYSRPEMLGLDVGRLSADVGPAALADRAALRERATAGEAFIFEWACRAKDGRSFWCEVAVRRATFNERDAFLLTAQDITGRRIAQEGLAYRDRILHAVTQSVADLIVESSLAVAMARALETVGKALDVDRLLVLEGSRTDVALADAISFGWEKSGDRRVIDAQPVPTAAQEVELTAWIAPLLRGEPVISYGDTATGFVADMLKSIGARSILLVPVQVGGKYWGHAGVENSAGLRRWTSVEIDALSIFARVVGTVISRKATLALVERMAGYDMLTGLPNRRLFIGALEQAIGRAHRSGQSFGVLYLDLDHLKDTNDTLGHPAGDRLLQIVAERLQANVRETDTIARFGGDEFAAIGIDVREAADAAMLAEKLLYAMSQPFTIDGNEIRSGASIGIALYGPDSPNAEALLSHADVALYRAKADGRGTYRFYTEAMDAEVRARVAIEAELSHAISEGQFFVVYQPQVDVTSGRIVGLEALVRWHHPVRGILQPGSFIREAEKSGAIVALGRFVLEEACRQMNRWVDAGIAPPLVAVNVSGVQFKAPLEFEAVIGTILAEFGLAPHLLELEFTESVLMMASIVHNDMLLRLRARGLRIAIDDFGTGYSSLDYLRRFHVDRLKIPETFVTDLCSVPSNASIVRATLGLARELDIEVIVEGVETAAQLTLLKDWGCRNVQGFYFSKPLSADKATTVLRAGKVGPARQPVLAV
jgi:diguanylate cyclase (GGDEF)-like protein/PAS domain S-box-containing protein